MMAFDVSDPAQPIMATTRDLPPYAVATVSGDVGYIAHEGKLQLVDAATFNTTLGEIELGYAGSAYFVEVAGHLAYIGVNVPSEGFATLTSILVVDISNPAQPQAKTASQLDIPQRFSTTAMGEALFLLAPANVHGDCPYSLHVVDITEPSPQHAAFEPQSCIRDIAVDGDTLVAASDDRGLQIFNAGDGASVTLVGEFAYPPGFTSAGAIALNRDVAYLVSGNASRGEPMTLRVLDRTQPAAPVVVGPPLDLPPDNGIEGLHVRENRLYIVPYNFPMLALDISQPANPGLVTDAGIQPMNGNWPVPALAGNALYMTADGSLQIWDISDAANAVLIKTIPAARGAFPQQGSVIDRYLIASGSPSPDLMHLQLYDASDPFQPLEVGRLQLPEPYLLVTTITGDTLYAITSDLDRANFYLYVLDFSVPAQPAAAGRFVLPSSVQAMVPAGDTIFLSTEEGIWALNVSDNSQPYLAGYLQLPGSNRYNDLCRTCHLSVDGDWLYVARSDAGLFVSQVEK
jgi:hypothetical protein